MNTNCNAYLTGEWSAHCARHVAKARMLDDVLELEGQPACHSSGFMRAKLPS